MYNKHDLNHFLTLSWTVVLPYLVRHGTLSSPLPLLSFSSLLPSEVK